jgi:hypothetical protein
MKFETHAKQWHKNVSQPRLRILKAIASCKRIHQMMMLTSEKDMANSVEPANIDTFINNAAPGVATPEQDTISDVLFVAHW